jgi:hypothetical protein
LARQLQRQPSMTNYALLGSMGAPVGPGGATLVAIGGSFLLAVGLGVLLVGGVLLSAAIRRRARRRVLVGRTIKVGRAAAA